MTRRLSALMDERAWMQACGAYAATAWTSARPAGPQQRERQEWEEAQPALASVDSKSGSFSRIHAVSCTRERTSTLP